MSDVVEHQAARLETLADRINEEHRQAEAAMNEALLHARNAGEGLNEAKDRTEHGEWGDWVRNNFEGSERTARVYQRIARNWTRIENRQRDADLSIRGAVRLLRENGEDDPRPETAEPGVVEPGVAYYVKFPEWALGVDYGWVWPSHHDEFSWVTLIEDPPDADGTGQLTTWNRPIRCSMVEDFLDAIRVPVDEAEWKAMGEPDRMDYNLWVASSREDQLNLQFQRWKRAPSANSRWGE